LVPDKARRIPVRLSRFRGCDFAIIGSNESFALDGG
jgi:hypothetical protein